MNEKNTIKELLDQVRNSNWWVKEIAAAYLGVDPEDVIISVKRSHQK